MERNGKEKLIFLEYLRIYAFLNVLITHLFPQYTRVHFAINANIFAVYFEKLFNLTMPTILGGGTGVPVFFLVSGYIIFKVGERETSASFAIRRIFRIYPLYIFAILCQFQISDGKIPPWSSLWPRFSLLGDFMGTGQVLNGVDWTLRIEIVFYALVFALSLCKCLRSGLAIYLLPIIIITCLIMPAFPAWSPSTRAHLNLFFPFFMLGAGIYYYETRRIGLKFLVFIAVLVFFGYAGKGTIIAFGLFVVAWLMRDQLINSRKVTVVSGLTYSVYLYHAWFFGDMMKMLGPITSSLFLRNVVSLIILFAVCYLVHRLVERPFITLGRIISKRVDRLFDRFSRWAHGLIARTAT